HSIHITSVPLNYESVDHRHVKTRWVFSVGSNFLLNLTFAAEGREAPLIDFSDEFYLKYAIEGPRGTYKQYTVYKVPIYVRGSTFRLPTSPTSPVITISSGTGVADFQTRMYRRYGVHLHLA
ncbi:hypothetical protein OH77DRAFT_805261, partial [Trametes cingulata]